MRVVLVSPAGPLNVGSAARVMKNMGLTEMVLVAPRCDRRDPEALQMAVHGRDVLTAAREVATLPEALAGCRRIAVTLGRDTHAPIPVVSLREAMPWLAAGQAAAGQAAIVFGREDHGLTNEELKYAQVAIQIPTSDAYPSLNLAQAIGICCYEFWLTQQQENPSPSASRSLLKSPRQASRLSNQSEQDLSGQDLSGQDLPGQDLPGGNLPDQNLSGQDLSGQDLPGGNLPDQNWSGQNLSGQDLPGQDLPGGNLPDQNWSGQNWSGQNWSGQNLPGRNFLDQNVLDQNLEDLAPFETIEAYYQDLENLLQTVGFLYPHTAASRMAKLRHLGDRATLTAPDVAMLRGMLRQIRWAIAHLPRE
jgi:tRNA/rRNA methyltransferase